MLREKILHKLLKVPHTLHVGVDTGRADHTIVLIHGLARTHRVWSYALEKLPATSRIISVDLLGFGNSPKPEWGKYNTTEQALSLRATLKKRKVRGKITIVGHSLGALVAIEYARRYPNSIKSLLLCSTPLYKSEPKLLFRKLALPQSEHLYKNALRTLRRQKDFTKKLNYYARKVKFVQDDFIVDDSNILGVTRSIEMAIENQYAFEWLMQTSHQVELIYGRLDPFVIKKYYKILSKHNPNVHVHPILAAHEINRSRVYADILHTVLYAQAINKDTPTD